MPSDLNTATTNSKSVLDQVKHRGVAIEIRSPYALQTPR